MPKRDIIDQTDFHDILDPDIRHPVVSGGIFHTCTNCQREFIPTRYWNHFCCADCRMTYNNARAPKWKPKIDDLI